MKKTPKLLGISLLCVALLFGFTTKASTGEITTGTTISYTGSLMTYLDAQEKGVSTSLTTTYTKVYSAFTKTGLNILKSVDYQSLVCLGALKDESLLVQIQKDKTAMTISFKKDFIELENKIEALEEKRDLQQNSNVNVFDAGTTYESEKALLKDLIDAKVKLHKGFIANYETDYLAKITTFLSSYLQYSTVNKDLIQSIKAKIAKVQTVLTAFGEVETMITKINGKVTGLDELIQKLETTKSNGLSNLDKTIQSLIATNIKKYKKLQNLSGELTQQKMFVMGQFQMDLDEYLTNNLQSRYDRTQYLTLKTEVDNFRKIYYTTNDQLNCSNVLSATDIGTALSGKIATMNVLVGSGLAKIEKEGISTAFKDQLSKGFQSLYVTKFKQRYNEYTTYLKTYIKTALRNLVASLAQTQPITTTETPIATGTTIPEASPTVRFTRAFTIGEYHNDIKALQNILTTLGFYSGAIDGVYNQKTASAVYKFQVSRGLVNASNPKAWGYFGPATRNAINNTAK